MSTPDMPWRQLRRVACAGTFTTFATFSATSPAQTLVSNEDTVKSGGVITIIGSGQPTGLPGSIPTTLESISAAHNSQGTYRAWETNAAVGDKSGEWSWRLDASHADSHGQPLTFATRLLSSGVAGVAGAAGTAVSGAVLGANNAGSPWWILGTGTECRTEQDHFKAKLAWDLTPSVRATYVLGVWRNESHNRPISYLRDAGGSAVNSGSINIGGQSYSGAQALTGADFALTDESLNHRMQGLSIQSHPRGVWDWEAVASRYDYDRDDKRQNASTNPLPNAASGGAGTLADGSGTGWLNLALKGTWRPSGLQAAHSLDFGLQIDRYTLSYVTSNITGNWLRDGAGSLANAVYGKTELQSLYAQDAWSFAPLWKTVLGLRAEQWRASDGATVFSASSAQGWPARRENHLSPKAALSWQASEEWVLKASTGRAVRMPTVSELHGATSMTNSQFINDPNLHPERSWTTELTAERDLMARGLLRLTLFAEDTRDSLYTQTTPDASANRNISRVQNVGRIATRGLETTFSGSDVGLKGLDLSASVTYADSIIKENSGFVVTPGDIVGKWQPNIPKWRATMLATWRSSDKLSASLGARYSGPQFRTLNNADVNGFTYQGVSKYFSTDVRLHYKFGPQWSAALGRASTT